MVATSRPATTRVPLKAHAPSPMPSWEKFRSHHVGSASVSMAKTVPTIKNVNNRAARSRVLKSIPAWNDSRPTSPAVTPVINPAPIGPSSRPGSPEPSNSPASRTLNPVTPPNAMVMAIKERFEITVCHGGMNCVSPRRCKRVLTTNAIAAIRAEISAIGIMIEPGPANGRISPQNTRTAATAPSRNEPSVAQRAWVSSCRARSVLFIAPSNHMSYMVALS